MPNTIHIPTPLRPFTDKNESVEVTGGTVGELLADLTKKYAGLRKHLYADDGRLRNFVNAVTLDEVSGEGANEGVPLGIVLGRRHDLLVPERMHVLTERELLGHETDFDKGANAIGEQPVVNLVNVGEVVDGVALFVFVVYADFVVEDGVEADVVEIGDFL